MGLLDIFERALLPGKKKPVKQFDMKEIFCPRKDDGYLKQIRTAVVGTEYKNPDGSERQQALAQLKIGERVRLIWDAGNTGGKDKILVFRKGHGRELNPAECFGRLDDRVAAKVIRWLTKSNIVTAAKVQKILGGTRKRPKLGCVLQLATYPGPKPRQDA